MYFLIEVIELISILLISNRPVRDHTNHKDYHYFRVGSVRTLTIIVLYLTLNEAV